MEFVIAEKWTFYTETMERFNFNRIIAAFRDRAVIVKRNVTNQIGDE